jgi:hypothetical protein
LGAGAARIRNDFSGSVPYPAKTDQTRSGYTTLVFSRYFSDIHVLFVAILPEHSQVELEKVVKASFSSAILIIKIHRA